MRLLHTLVYTYMHPEVVDWGFCAWAKLYKYVKTPSRLLVVFMQTSCRGLSLASSVVKGNCDWGIFVESGALYLFGLAGGCAGVQDW